MLDVEIQKDRLRPVRVNGLVNGVNPYQFVSWTYTLFDILLSYYFAFQLPDHARETFLIILTMVVTLLLYSCFNATLCDPTDPVVLQEKRSKKLNLEFKCDLKGYCLVCEAHVQERTKHCQSCNKCCSIFDHHCIWLNNCIADKNYSDFFQLVICLVLFKIIKLAQVSYLLAQRDLQILVLVSIAVDPLILVLISYLLAMHCYFRYKKITTYDWIKMRREQKIKSSKPSHRPNESVGYGQLLSTSKRFDLKSQLGLKTDKSSNQFFPTQTPPEMKKTQPSSQNIHIPSLFNTKPTSPGNSEKPTVAMNQAKDLDDIKIENQNVLQVIVEDSEPMQNESSEGQEEEEEAIELKPECVISSNQPSLHAQPPPQACYTFQIEQNKASQEVQQKNSQFMADNQTE